MFFIRGRRRSNKRDHRATSLTSSTRRSRLLKAGPIFIAEDSQQIMTSGSIEPAARMGELRAVRGGGRRRRWSALGLVPPLTLALFLGPIAGGLIGTWAPAFGVLPALGGTAPTLDPWRALMGAPGLAESVLLTAGTGLGA